MLECQKKGYFYLMIALLFGDLLHIAAMGGYVYYLDQQHNYIKMPAYALQFLITFTVISFRFITIANVDKIYVLEDSKKRK